MKTLGVVQNMHILSQLKQEMRKLANPKRAQSSLWIFKTGSGEYGEGDRFLGIGGTAQRKLAKKYMGLPLVDVLSLLKSKIHEYRQTAILILVNQYQKGNTAIRKQIFGHYIKNTQHINNWDLVDISAPHIVGDYLIHKKRDVLYKFVKSKDLWKKRIAVLATFAFIRENDFKDTLKIAKILLRDQHDLIHKAVGWMLREVGNRDIKIEEKFLKKYSKVMPRVMLRYAIEKFPKKKRKKYLEK